MKVWVMSRLLCKMSGPEKLGPNEFIVQEIGPDPSVHTMEIASMWVTV